MTLSTTLLIITLVAMRLAAVFLIGRVIFRQLQFMGLHDAVEYTQTRKTMLALSICVLAANMVPLTLDLLMFILPELVTHRIILLTLSSNALGDLFQALLICKLYSNRP